MTTTIRLFDPTAPPREARGIVPTSLPGQVKLAGAVVGFIDNAKPNFDHLVSDIAEILMSQYGVRQVITRRKPSASIPATEVVIQELAEACDVVITGSGD